MNQQIVSDSLDELKHIMEWIRRREKDRDKPITVLIGGWAVYAYNPWYGSIDIDLVTNNRTKESLKHHLIHERGFSRYRTGGINSVCRSTDYRQDIIIDFGDRIKPYRFEGTDEKLNFDILDGNTVERPIQGNVIATIPNRSLLLLFKMKASWDRSYRIDHQTSFDVEYDRSKLVKDHADIIALLDPKKGGHDIDVSFIGESFEKYPFLIERLESVAGNIEGIRKYDRIERDEVNNIISKLLFLTK